MTTHIIIRVRQTLQDAQAELNWACRNGPNNLKQSYRMVELLLQWGVPVDSLPPNGITSLGSACYLNHGDIAELLLAHGANPNALWSPGQPLLQLAASCGHINIVKLLLKNGASVAYVRTDGFTILHAATAFLINQEILEVLIAAGADIDARSATNDTPLHTAALDGDTERVECFLKNNACIDATNDDGLTASDMAQSMLTEHEDAMEYMSDDEIDEYDEDHQDPPFSRWYDVMDMIEQETRRREDLRKQIIQQEICLAVCMGHDKRLGAGSMINWLDPDVTRLLLQWV